MYIVFMLFVKLIYTKYQLEFKISCPFFCNSLLEIQFITNNINLDLLKLALVHLLF